MLRNPCGHRARYFFDFQSHDPQRSPTKASIEGGFVFVSLAWHRLTFSVAKAGYLMLVFGFWFRLAVRTGHHSNIFSERIPFSLNLESFMATPALQFPNVKIHRFILCLRCLFTSDSNENNIGSATHYDPTTKYSKKLTYEAWNSRSFVEKILELFSIPIKEQL